MAPQVRFTYLNRLTLFLISAQDMLSIFNLPSFIWGRIAALVRCGLLLQMSWSSLVSLVCLSVTTVSSAKANEPIEVPFLCRLLCALGSMYETKCPLPTWRIQWNDLCGGAIFRCCHYSSNLFKCYGRVFTVLFFLYFSLEVLDKYRFQYSRSALDRSQSDQVLINGQKTP